MKPSYTLAELESAINYWRARSPSTGEESALCAEAAALAEPYALLIFNARHDVSWNNLARDAQEALRGWVASQPVESGKASAQGNPPPDSPHAR
ncbi:MAG TPA: DUF3717 domain-containing protein [Burkholderiaceae bacterium]|nr:DUF3717 domain-containing protein [Burkholderiaceae bacterium]